MAPWRVSKMKVLGGGGGETLQGGKHSLVCTVPTNGIVRTCETYRSSVNTKKMVASENNNKEAQKAMEKMNVEIDMRNMCTGIQWKKVQCREELRRFVRKNEGQQGVRKVSGMQLF